MTTGCHDPSAFGTKKMELVKPSAFSGTTDTAFLSLRLSTSANMILWEQASPKTAIQVQCAQRMVH